MRERWVSVGGHHLETFLPTKQQTRIATWAGFKELLHQLLYHRYLIRTSYATRKNALLIVHLWSLLFPIRNTYSSIYLRVTPFSFYILQRGSIFASPYSSSSFPSSLITPKHVLHFEQSLHQFYLIPLLHNVNQFPSLCHKGSYNMNE